MARPQIFISYSRKDKARVEAIARKLRAKCYRTWIDTEEITGGVAWARAINRAIAASDVVLVILSKSSCASSNVKKEIDFATELEKQIVPLRLDSDVEPSDLKNLGIDNLEYVDFAVDEQAGWKELLEILPKSRICLYVKLLALVLVVLLFAAVSLYFLQPGPSSPPPVPVSILPNFADNVEVYITNAHILEAQKYKNNRDTGPEEFFRLKFQFACIPGVSDCYAGVIFNQSVPLFLTNEAKHLVFQARGSRGDEVFGVALRDSLLNEERVYQITGYTEQSRVTTQWQTVRIPLTEFSSVHVENLKVVTFFVDANFTSDQIVQFDIAGVGFE